MKKKVFYWCPFTSYVATVKSVINSAESLNWYSYDFQSYVVNACNEWKDYSNDLNRKNIKSIDLNPHSNFNKFEKKGFVKSRIAYFYIFFKSFFPLINLLKRDKPDYLIVHLITSLPIFIFYFFNFKTKLILRISGLPKMNFLRKFLWKFGSKNIYKITCPTEATLVKMSQYKFFANKLSVLHDPIIKNSEIILKLNKKDIPTNIELINFISDGNFFLSVGRLTKQKNFIFLIDCIFNLKKNHKNIKFLIIGSGEQKSILLNKIKEYDLEKNIKILDHTENIYFYMKKCRAFVLTSLWEDPGFVLIEAAYMNASIISSDCPNGPLEILNYGVGGYLFSSNKQDSFIDTLNAYLSDSKMNTINKKINAKIQCKKYSMLSHYNSIVKILT
tara:strand:+ start:38769 stop:39932 length:1164 start_codon:yes stop_codon:yes gene_type:complete